MKEIISLRKPREKHFLNGDGTFTVKVYDQDIHFLKNDKYEEIDNTILEKEDSYENKENDFIVSFSKGQTDSIFTLIKNNRKASFNIENIQFHISTNQNKIYYRNILKNIDLTFEVLSNGVKDTITLKEKDNDISKFIYKIKTNLKMEVSNGNIVLKDNDTVLFQWKKPILLDNQNHSYPIFYDVEQNGNEYSLKFDFDKEILENEQLYPFIIDPVITNGEQGNVYDTYIYEGDTNVNRNIQDVLKVGVDSSNKVYRTLMKFDLPEIGTGYDIINAKVTLVSHKDDIGKSYDVGDNGPFFSKEGTTLVHQITSDWQEENANWSFMHDKYNNKIEDFFGITRSSKKDNTITLNTSEFNITSLTKKWYAGTPNYGVLLKSYKEIYDSHCKEFWLYSKNNNISSDTVTDPKPYLMIQYRNQNGLESYMSYQSVSFGGGISHINHLTGNVTNVYEINKTVVGKLPVTLNLYYNSNDVVLNHDYGYTVGYKFNFHQTLKELKIENTDYLEYLDEDGSIHYFYKLEDKYYDEDGLNLVAEKETDHYILTDKTGNKMKFCLRNNLYYLTELIDTQENHVTIFYNNQNQIIKVIDANNEEINLTYEENNITIVSNYTTTIIHLLNNKITRIELKDGRINLTYNNGLISFIKDKNQKGVEYRYYDTKPYRLKKIIERGIGNEEGTSLEFIYSFLVTKVIDNKGRVNTYSFNNQGNTIGLTNLKYTNDFRDSYGVYKAYDEYNNTSKNRLLLETNATKYTNNLFLDSGFEKEMDTSLISNITTENPRSGNKCLKISNYTCIDLPIIKETANYTFSGYFNQNTSFELGIREKDTTKLIASRIITSNNDYERYTLTSLLQVGKRYQLMIEPINGVVYLDDVQLEQGDVANLRNEISNSDFGSNMNSWTNNATNRDGETITNDDEIVTLDNQEHAYLMHCYPDQSKTLTQTINVAGKKNEAFKRLLKKYTEKTV